MAHFFGHGRDGGASAHLHASARLGASADPAVDAAAAGAALLYSLERNWQGDASSNPHVLSSLAFAEQLERSVLVADPGNWRALAHVYRAYYDAYTQARLRFELQRQAAVYEAVAMAIASVDCDTAEARAALLTPFTNPRAAKWLAHLHGLATAINSSSALCSGCVQGGMAILLSQAPLLSLDTVHTPLADDGFLRAKLQHVSTLRTAGERRAALRPLLLSTDPGPSGFYDELGASPRSPRLERGYGAAADPQYSFAPLVQFNEDPTRWPPCGQCGAGDGEPQPLAWMRWAQTYGDTPLSLRYEGLSPTAHYVVRLVYSYQGWGEYPVSRLYALSGSGESALLHDYQPAPKPARPLEFAVPWGMTSGGTVTIQCRQPPGSAQDRSGRGCRIAQVWLIVNDTSSSSP